MTLDRQFEQLSRCPASKIYRVATLTSWDVESHKRYEAKKIEDNSDQFLYLRKMPQVEFHTNLGLKKNLVIRDSDIYKSFGRTGLFKNYWVW